MQVGIIDYGLGNVRSVVGAVRYLGFEPVLTAEAAGLKAVDKLILPGVGAFGDGMKNLARRGLLPVLEQLVRRDRRPILGICLGAQLMAQESFEFGHHRGLGWIDAKVVPLAPEDTALRVPHVGWNNLRWHQEDVLLEGIEGDALFYFVHSFHIVPASNDAVIAESDYGGSFMAAWHADNIFATQFHPEKSQRQGLALLANFLQRN